MLRRRGEIGGMLKGPSAQTLGTSLVAQGFIVISGIVAARALGVEGRGTLAILWLLPMTLALLGGLGIPQATTYYVARESGNASGVVRISAEIMAALAVGLGVAYGVGLGVAGSNASFPLVDGILSALLVPLFLAQNLATATLLGMKRYTSFNVGRVVPALLYAVGVTILFVLDRATLTSILVVGVSSWALGAAGTWVLVRHDLPGGGRTPTATRAEIVKFGVRGVIGTVSPVDDVRIDQLFVGFLLDSRALGLYVAAIAFCNLPRFFAQSIGSVNYPRVAAASDPSGAWAIAARAARLGVIGIALTVAVLLVALPHLLPLLFGEAFSEAVNIGYVLLLAALFLSIHRLLTELARGLGHPGYGSLTELVNLAVFLVGLVVFATPASTIGIATAVLAGGIASSLMLSSMLVALRWKQMERGT